MDPVELGKWVFEDAAPELKDNPGAFQKLSCDIVVAGNDFGGGGKSIEHPIVAMQGAGIKLVLAESFSRYNFRNAINRGLPAITCPEVTGLFNTGDTLECNLLTGEVKNITTGGTLRGIPLPDLVLGILEAGGILEFTRKSLASS